jgi:hypothetical protein
MRNKVYALLNEKQFTRLPLIIITIIGTCRVKLINEDNYDDRQSHQMAGLVIM